MANEYSNISELIRDYYDKPVGEYLNRTITVNEVELDCDIYRVAPETILTSSIFTGCTAVDANTQIIIGKDMSVASETTLIPPYRCKGIIIGDVGTFTNEGTISMTARGAVGEGKNIQLTASYMISAVGGAGGTGKAGSGGSPAANVFSCGGGGSGSAYDRTTTGTGGSGTSFSGGAGSGGNASTSGTTQDGSSEGGIGSNGKASDGLSGGYDGYASGGVGNPSGTSATSSGRAILQSPSGTGGLLVVLCSSFVNIGTMEAKGVTAARAYTTSSGLTSLSQDGGSSGGGCILVLTKNSSGSGTITALGGQTNDSTTGTPGGAGGTGTQEILIVEDLILQNLPVEFAITDTEHLDNIEPSEAVRFLGLTDDDELYYDIMGKRHASGSGHIIENEEGTALTKRKILAVTSPLTASDNNTNETTELGLDTNVDFSSAEPPSQLSPGTNYLANLEDVNFVNPQDGQGMVYDGTQQKWVNGAGGLHEYSTQEKVVGTWIDGKPIYEKTFHCNNFNVSNTISYTNIMLRAGIDQCISATGTMLWDYDQSYANKLRLPFIMCLNGAFINIDIIENTNSDYFQIRAWRSSGSTNVGNVYVTLQYTKTTD